jgi:hypothetical protein
VGLRGERLDQILLLRWVAHVLKMKVNFTAGPLEIRTIVMWHLLPIIVIKSAENRHLFGWRWLLKVNLIVAQKAT